MSQAVVSKRSKLAEYKHQIDQDIKKLAKNVLYQYEDDQKSLLTLKPFLDLLLAGGKRIRGSLVLAGYEMAGGLDKKLAYAYAQAVEMMHAYILMIDDIQDRSATRRGRPTAHVGLQDWHVKSQLLKDSGHFGISVALNSALSGAHLAQSVMLDAMDPKSPEAIKAASLINQTMLDTAIGQTGDILNEVDPNVSLQDVMDVIDRKTAIYTFTTPLKVGLYLAGVSSSQAEVVDAYCRNLGRAFQLGDDILGIFGDSKQTGKPSGDDIREGKITLLTYLALQADNSDNLRKILSQQNPTAKDIDQARKIIISTGALTKVKKDVGNYIDAAQKDLTKINSEFSNKDAVDLLSSLASSLSERTT